MRMQEAIQHTSQRLQLDAQIVAQLPKQAINFTSLIGLSTIANQLLKDGAKSLGG